MQKVDSHPVRAKWSLEDWLVAAAIAFFYLLILAMTFFSTYWAFHCFPSSGLK